MEQIATEGVDGVSEELQSRRPKDDKYNQQTMQAWSPYVTPWKAISGYVIIGLFFIPLGIFLGIDSSDVVELRYQYDGAGSDGTECSITEYNENRECNISFAVEEDMSGPVYVYYELTNFYQNHATYVDSQVQEQLEGTVAADTDDCTPLTYNGTRILHPCGLIANSLFNDVIQLSEGGVMSETGIAWESDVDDKFVQPDGFASAVCESDDCATCLSEAGNTDSSGDTVFDGCALWEDLTDETTYAYYYPDEDTYQYIYETIPQVINPIEGITNEHFIVWMRTSGLHEFRKLYGSRSLTKNAWCSYRQENERGEAGGHAVSMSYVSESTVLISFISGPPTLFALDVDRIEDGVAGGTNLTFTINANYVTTFFDGTKSLVISTTNDTGGRNPYWGQSFLTLGVAIWILAALGAFKERCCPREMGDLKKLVDDPE